MLFPPEYFAIILVLVTYLWTWSYFIHLRYSFTQKIPSSM